MTLKLLFLDFDGVTHPAKCDVAQLFCRMPLIWGLLNRYSALQLAVHSSWRHPHDDAELHDFLFHGSNITAPRRFWGGTPRNYMGRWESIERVLLQELLRTAKHTSYRILDDEPKKFPSYVVESPQFIQCNPETGIDDAVMTKLVSWLDSTDGE